MKSCEKDLFLMARKGDVEAYEKLIESYEGKVFSLIHAAVGDKALASELTQDVFVKVYKDLSKEKTENRLSQIIYGTTRKLLISICNNSRCLSINGHSLNLI